MTFTSLSYLLFLGLVFTLYWSLRARSPQNLLLLIASYSFYSWWDYRFCALMLVSSLVDFAVGRGLARTEVLGKRRLLLACSLVANLGLLGFFKYYNFFVASAADLLVSMGFNPSEHSLQIVLPVGISFYTFQTMSYSFDVYAHRLKPCRSLLDYMTYVAFFPQLVAGPIERGSRFLPQFEQPRVFDQEKARDGLRQMLWGFFKKMVLADGLGEILVDPIYADPEASGPAYMLATFAFALQIYCDFSAYSDIAIGTGRLFGFELMRNFAYPYFSRSVGEFWRRWHISLSTWFRDYLYIPMGGSRVGPFRRCRNVLVTFLVSGLWHGASWNFVLWGGVHGLALLPEVLSTSKEKVRGTEVPGGDRFIPSAGTIARVLLTFLLVNLAWVFFRSEDLSGAIHVFSRIFGDLIDAPAYADLLANELVTGRPRNLMLTLMIFILIEWGRRKKAHALQDLALPLPFRWLIYSALIWLCFSLGARRHDQFIYFQF